MNKKDIQIRVLKDGKPLALSKFSWCDKTLTFSSDEAGLVLDFSGMSKITIKCGYECTINCGGNCTINCGDECTIKCGSCCTINCDGRCFINCKWNCTINCGDSCTINCGRYCTIKCGWGCNIDCGYECTINCGRYCTIKCGSYCTINCDGRCTIKCDGRCTINCGDECTIKCGNYCVLVLRSYGKATVLQSNNGDEVKTPPYDTLQGFIVNGMHEGKRYIIADGILSEVLSEKGDAAKVYTVKNWGDDKQSYLIESDGKFSHGKTLKQAKKDLVYKLADRDTSKYDGLSLETVVTHDEAIQMYMTITGACSSGTKYFVERMADKVKTEYTVGELIKLTDGQYESTKFKQFFYGGINGELGPQGNKKRQ